MTTTVSFGKRLKQLREERDLNKTQMAELLKISRVAYGHYEEDKRHPECTLIPGFCKALGVTADYLLGISETRAPIYAKVAETTGLNEESILYLKRMHHSSLNENINIINLLLNDEPDASYFDYVCTTPPPPMSDQEKEHRYNEYIARSKQKDQKPILEELSEEWSYNDYVAKMNDEERYAYELKKNAEILEQYPPIPEPMTTIEEINQSLITLKQQQEFLEHEWQKSNLLSRIGDYLTYHEGCNLYSSGQSEPLSNEHQICLSIGNKYMHFPSKESNELFEFMLLQKVIDALKIFKKNFHERENSKEA